jgi:hypothetical protein
LSTSRITRSSPGMWLLSLSVSQCTVIANDLYTYKYEYLLQKSGPHVRRFSLHSLSFFGVMLYIQCMFHRCQTPLMKRNKESGYPSVQLACMWEEITCRYDICRATSDVHIGHLETFMVFRAKGVSLLQVYQFLCNKCLNV